MWSLRIFCLTILEVKGQMQPQMNTDEHGLRSLGLSDSAFLLQDMIDMHGRLLHRGLKEIGYVSLVGKGFSLTNPPCVPPLKKGENFWVYGLRGWLLCFTEFLIRCVFLILIFALVGCAMPSNRLVTVVGQTMGTTFQVKIVRGEAVLDVEELDREINARLVEVNRQMSTYQDDSEISQFNRSHTTDWVGISSDFAYVLSVAREISLLSDGAFDITVGPLVNLWGFGPEAVPERIPPADSIAARTAWTGYGKVEVDLSKSAVKKAMPDVYCDLSAVAKGFGVDRIASYLDSLGMGHYFIEIGGEVRTKGQNHLGHFWRVGIASPSGRGGASRALSMHDQSMATSGDYHNYFEKDGVRYSHTIDPRTGRPITHALASVSVVHELCAYADGLATAINVMGPEKGLVFAEEQKLAVFIVVRNGEGFVEVMTSEFGKLLEKN